MYVITRIHAHHGITCTSRHHMHITASHAHRGITCNNDDHKVQQSLTRKSAR